MLLVGKPALLKPIAVSVTRYVRSGSSGCGNFAFIGVRRVFDSKHEFSFEVLALFDQFRGALAGGVVILVEPGEIAGLIALGCLFILFWGLTFLTTTGTATASTAVCARNADDRSRGARAAARMIGFATRFFVGAMVFGFHFRVRPFYECVGADGVQACGVREASARRAHYNSSGRYWRYLNYGIRGSFDR